MKATARRWRPGFWRVKFADGLNLYPITDDEVEAVKRQHDVTVKGGAW